MTPQNPENAPVHLDLQAEWHRLAEGVRQSGAPILLARLAPQHASSARRALAAGRGAERLSSCPALLRPCLGGGAGPGGRSGAGAPGRHGPGSRRPEGYAPEAGSGGLERLRESAASARSVSQALLDGGLARAVVGHERSVLDSEALAFAARLYAELCGGFPLQDAWEKARKEITTHEVILLGEENLRFEGLSAQSPGLMSAARRAASCPRPGSSWAVAGSWCGWPLPWPSRRLYHHLRAAWHGQVQPAPGGCYVQQLAFSRRGGLCRRPQGGGGQSCQR